MEFLAFKWAVTEKFHDYLFYATSFTVYTDNNPLTYMLSSTKLSAVGHRWVAELADFNFNIKYRPGKSNIEADMLSRLPLDPVNTWKIALQKWKWIQSAQQYKQFFIREKTSHPGRQQSQRTLILFRRTSRYRFSVPTTYFRRHTKSSTRRP